MSLPQGDKRKIVTGAKGAFIFIMKNLHWLSDQIADYTQIRRTHVAECPIVVENRRRNFKMQTYLWAT
ncbi:MAG: hypothetical protein EBW03_04995 [Rhodobacteraceae bacterium]|nr:hypothetical protein [Paracoccaceae bacterium]